MMSQNWTMRAALAAVMLVAALGSPALAAKKAERKPQKQQAAAAGGIPAHPSELRYGPLDFDVPDAAKYRHQLSNGVPVFIAEDHALPLVSLSVTLRGGAYLDPAGKPGLAMATGSMLRRGGAASMSAEQFDERVDFLAANLNSFGGDESSGATLNCITGVADEALDLLFQMLKSPRFEQARIDVERENLLEEMKQRNDSPTSISNREWGWLLRGQDFFVTRELTRDELFALDRDAMVEFHGKYWRPENMYIAAWGDVKPDEILAKLEKHFAGFGVLGPPAPWPPPGPKHTPQPGVYYVDKDIPQGRVVLGHLGYQRKAWDDPEPFALDLMNEVLGGGGFTSRLLKRIRSDEGLAYSAGSSCSVGEHWPGVFQAFYQSKSETVAYAAKIALEEIERIRTSPVSEEELRVAKNSFIDVFPRRFESAGQVAGTFVDDVFQGRPHEYWKAYRDRMRAVTVEQVLAAAKEHVHPDRLMLLIVGKWDAIQPGDADGRASMAEFHDGRATRLPLRDPLTLKPIE
jgi:predicted Zn-dependent peptidase